jgi:hypothetical protein
MTATQATTPLLAIKLETAALMVMAMKVADRTFAHVGPGQTRSSANYFDTVSRQIIFSSSVVASLQGFAAFASCVERLCLTRCAPSKTNVKRLPLPPSFM